MIGIAGGGATESSLRASAPAGTFEHRCVMAHTPVRLTVAALRTGAHVV
jgi:hypothetical protein